MIIEEQSDAEQPTETAGKTSADNNEKGKGTITNINVNFGYVDLIKDNGLEFSKKYFFYPSSAEKGIEVCWKLFF